MVWPSLDGLGFRRMEGGSSVRTATGIRTRHPEPMQNTTPPTTARVGRSRRGPRWPARVGWASCLFDTRAKARPLTHTSYSAMYLTTSFVIKCWWQRMSSWGWLDREFRQRLSCHGTRNAPTKLSKSIGNIRHCMSTSNALLTSFESARPPAHRDNNQ